MKELLVLACIVGAAFAQPTTRWPDHDCTIDHAPDPDDIHSFLVKGQGTWNRRTCSVAHLVYEHKKNCTCVWPDKELTYGDCNTVNKPVPGEPGYIFQYWHPVDNVWYERNCHAVFPSTYHHNNDQLFFNVTGCACDWLPASERGPLTIDASPDCTLDMDIAMVNQPPMDSMGSFVQPFNPVWDVWPPKVELTLQAGRDAICFDATRLKSWFLTGNSKPNIWLQFGLYSRSQDDTNNFRCVLSDGCNWAGVHPATFNFWYRATPMAFRVEYRGTVWECNQGGSGIGSWVDIALFFGLDATLYVNNVMCALTRTGDVPNDYFRIQDTCQLNLGGNELEPQNKYSGCMSLFQEMSGLQCTSFGMPTP